MIAECVEPEQCLNYPNSFVKVIRENEQFKSYLDEGLVKTYPLKNAIKWHRAQCQKHLTKKQLSAKAVFRTGQPATEIWKECNFVNYDKKSEIAGLVSFYVLLDSNVELNSLIDEVTSWHNVTGYDLSEHAILKLKDENNQQIEVLKLTFEARFFKKDVVLTDWLYHVTDLAAAKKILAQGLVPKSKNNVFKYDNRVYLFNNADPMQIIAYVCMKASFAKNTKFVMFRIHSKALQENQLYKNGKMLFYVDPKYDVNDIAIYTYNNIPISLVDSKCTVLEVYEKKIISSNTIDIKDLN